MEASVRPLTPFLAFKNNHMPGGLRQIRDYLPKDPAKAYRCDCRLWCAVLPLVQAKIPEKWVHSKGSDSRVSPDESSQYSPNYH